MSIVGSTYRAPMTTYGGAYGGYGMPSLGSYVAPSMPTYGAPMMGAAVARAAPMMGGSISAPVATSVSIPSGSISAPMSLPQSNTFSGYTSTPFMPAPYYNPSTFGAPTTAFTGMPLAAPMASTVSSLPIGGSYPGGTFGGVTSIPRATYGPTSLGASYGTTYGSTYPSTYGTTYAAGTTYGAPTTYSSYGAPTTTYAGATTYAADTIQE